MAVCCVSGALLERVDFGVPFRARGGLGGIQVVDMLQAVSNRHFGRDLALVIIGQHLLVVIGGHAFTSILSCHLKD